MWRCASIHPDSKTLKFEASKISYHRVMAQNRNPQNPQKPTKAEYKKILRKLPKVPKKPKQKKTSFSVPPINTKKLNTFSNSNQSAQRIVCVEDSLGIHLSVIIMFPSYRTRTIQAVPVFSCKHQTSSTNRYFHTRTKYHSSSSSTSSPACRCSCL